MELVKQWVLSVCITLIISIVFSLMSPKGSMGRFYKTVISLFIFTSFIVPLLDLDFRDFKSDFDFSTDFEMQMVETAENDIEFIINKELESNGFYGAEIDVYAVEKDNEYDVKNITVCINSEDTNEVREILLNNLGLVCEVVNNE